MTRTRLAAALGAAAITLLAGCQAIFEPGMPVAAKWHSMWYMAEITGMEGKKFRVRYADNTDGVVAEDDLRPLLQRRDLKEGMAVVAVWGGGGRMYPGKVFALAESAAVVKWDDGSSPSEVKYGQLARP